MSILLLTHNIYKSPNTIHTSYECTLINVNFMDVPWRCYDRYEASQGWVQLCVWDGMWGVVQSVVPPWYINPLNATGCHQILLAISNNVIYSMKSLEIIISLRNL